MNRPYNVWELTGYADYSGPEMAEFQRLFVEQANEPVFGGRLWRFDTEVDRLDQATEKQSVEMKMPNLKTLIESWERVIDADG